VELENDRYIINGAHEAGRLQDILDSFITRFVLCGDCESPETDLKINKDNSISKICSACGASSAVDSKHKMVAHILKNPPPKVHSDKYKR